MQHSSSTAVWCTSSDKDAVNRIEVHINYWKTSKKKIFRDPKPDYLEIGLMAKNVRSFDEINFFVPSRISSRKVTDCGQYFKNTKICEGIFNKPLSATTQADIGPTFIELKHQDKLFCRVLPFTSIEDKNGKNTIETDLQISNELGGTVFTVTKHAIQEVSSGEGAENIDAYFRIRVDLGLSKNSPFIEIINPFDRNFVSGFNKVEYIDFRLNEARTLSDDVKRKLKNSSQTEISLVAFLTATKVLSELATSNKRWHKSRLLEHDIWDEYLPDGLEKGMMVYHWKAPSDTDYEKSSEPVQDFSAFVKLQTRESTFGTLLIYLVLFFLLSVAASHVAANQLPKVLEFFAKEPASSAIEISQPRSDKHTIEGDNQ